MKKLATGLIAGSAVLAVSAVALPVATASPASESSGDVTSAPRPDNRPGPLTERQDKLRAKAIAMLRSGDAKLAMRKQGGATVKLVSGPAGAPQAARTTTFVEFPVEKQDKIWTVLSQFSDVSAGEIAEPDRTVDNSTYWEPAFDLAYYEELFNGAGESMREYYEAVSSGRYSVTNEVEDWVTVPGSAATYGDNKVEDFGGSWQFIADTVDAWYAEQVAAGRTAQQINAELAALDEWDRYDFDADGDFNESDGYIDHFQAVHANEGEEAGGGSLGEDAIWSHRWYVNGDDFGTTGPTVGTEQNKYGGTQIGDSSFWIGDYTVEPENGGLGVFAHEFGHDLGLPDYYDTAGGENGTSFWTIMSSGSWLGHGAAAGDGIGTVPNLLGPEEKLELGWLDYTEVDAGEAGEFTLSPAQGSSAGTDQAVKVNLPEKTTITDYTTPPQGSHAWWSGRGDDLSNTLTRSVRSSRRVTVTAKAWYEIEAGYDYLYAEYSTNGDDWTQVGKPIDGTSAGKWKTLRYSYAPKGASWFRFRYQTDGGVNEAGAFLDQITVKTATSTFSDGVERGNRGWTADGWTISTGTDTRTTPMYYLIENRQYVGYDATLETGPYQFCCAYTKPNFVEFFKVRPGMLVWLVDDAYGDNNTSEHPGFGAALPVDAFSAPFSYADGTRPSNRRQPFDATFGLGSNPEMCLHKEVVVGKGGSAHIETVAACAPARDQLAVFDDTDPLAYWTDVNPQNSVQVAGAGVTAEVVGQDGDYLLVEVTNPAG